MDPSYATLGFINFLALEFVYKARKTNVDFPDAMGVFHLICFILYAINQTIE